MVKGFGGPASQLETFIEVPFQAGDRTIYPDGLLEATRAGRTWTCLVEVKTSSSELERPQVESYLDVARENDFDCVLTISNQIAPAPGVHPVDVDRRKLRRVALHHLSWAEVLTIAVQQRVHRGVSDPEQAWILGELIRYLEHPKSGALDFTDMGPSWVPVREALAAGTLRAADKGLAEVVSRWEQLLRFAALRLGRELGADVQVQLSRREIAEPSLRFATQSESLVGHGLLVGSLKIPDAVGVIDISADLRASRVVVSIDVDAPREGRAATRVNWLVRQLRDAPDGLCIDAFTAGARTSTSDLLRVVREYQSVLKAPQLPRTSRTAVEEAGIDIEPPTRDLQERDEPESEPSPPESGEPEAVVQGVATAAEQYPESPDEPPVGGEADVPEELVSWDTAHERLDHERSFDRPHEAAN